MFGISKRVLTVVGLLIIVTAIFIAQGGKKGTAQPGTSAPSGATCQVQVTANQLNIRSSPVASAPVVGTLNTGDVQPATATQQNGYRELAAGKWASAQFLKVVTGSC